MKDLLVKFGVTTAVLLLIVMLASCGSTNSISSNDNYRVSSATADNPFKTNLIAGAGNWPINPGTDVGEVNVWNNATTLFVKYVTDDGWKMSEAHLNIGWAYDKRGNRTVAPGQFDYIEEFDPIVTTYTFQIPLSEVNGPNIIIFAHAAVEKVTQIGGGNSEPIHFGLNYGAKDVLCGGVDLEVVGDNLVITINASSPWLLRETHAYVGYTPPPFAPGQWPFIHSPINPAAAQDTLTIPLSFLGNPQPGDYIYLGVHATVWNPVTGANESATAWNPENRIRFFNKQGKIHWKSYTWFYFPGDDGDPVYEYQEETAWGFWNDPNNYFPNLGFNRWGWFFPYSVD